MATQSLPTIATQAPPLMENGELIVNEVCGLRVSRIGYRETVDLLLCERSFADG